MREREPYQLAVGHELRELRKARKLSMRKLVGLLPSDITAPTIAHYEQGTRRCSVERFSEICRTLDSSPGAALTRVEHRVHPDQLGRDDTGAVTIDLARVAGSSDPRLLPLRRWAFQLLRADAERTEVTLTPVAVALLAELCGTTPDDVTDLARAA